MKTWTAEVQIQLQDTGALELHALTGIPAPDQRLNGMRHIAFGAPRAPSGTVSVQVSANDTREAFALALEEAARLARMTATE